MALDANGNWTPVLPDQPPASPCVFTELMACTGAPDDASGFDGDVRVDLANGDVYSKANGVWELVASGAGGGSNNISDAGSPIGVRTPDAINQIYRSTTGPGLWQATGPTNDDWYLWSGVDG